MIETPSRQRGRLRLPALLSPRAYASALADLVRLLRRRRLLTLEMAKREVRGEHSGYALGSIWGVAQPLFLMVVYAFIFGVVFRQKVGGTFELPRNFTVYMLAGLVPWLALQVSLVKSASVITGNANLVKQTLFDLEVLPIAGALAACMPLVVGFTFITIYTLVSYGELPWTYVLLPVAVGLQIVLMAGLAFLLSAVGAFFRDVRELVQMFAVAAIFLLPIVYLPGSVPTALEQVLWVNPFTYMVFCYQDVFYFGRIEHPYAWAGFGVLSLLAFAGGYRFFRRVRPYFGNVL